MLKWHARRPAEALLVDEIGREEKDPRVPNGKDVALVEELVERLGPAGTYSCGHIRGASYERQQGEGRRKGQPRTTTHDGFRHEGGLAKEEGSSGTGGDGRRARGGSQPALNEVRFMALDEVDEARPEDPRAQARVGQHRHAPRVALRPLMVLFLEFEHLLLQPLELHSQILHGVLKALDLALLLHDPFARENNSRGISLELVAPSFQFAVADLHKAKALFDLHDLRLVPCVG